MNPLIARAFCAPGLSSVLLAAACEPRGGQPEERPAALVVGKPIHGEWTTGDSIVLGYQADHIDLRLTDERRVRIVLRTDEQHARLVLLAEDDDSRLTVFPIASGLASVVLALRAEDRYRYTRLAVEAPIRQEPRRYSLGMIELPGSFAWAGQTAVIVPGESRDGLLETFDNHAGTAGHRLQTGLIDRVGLLDRFNLVTDSGTAVIITVSSADFDPVLSIATPGRLLAAFDDDGGGGTTASLSHVARDDTVTFAVMSLGDPHEGRYRVTVAADSARPRGGADDSVPGFLGFGSVPPPEYLACRGKPMRRSLAYDSTRAGRHATAVVQTDQRGVVTFDRWGAMSGSPVELVLCLTQESRPVGTECRYRDGPAITRVRNRWRGRLVEARTTRVLASVQLEGNMPRQCEFVEMHSLTRIEGSLPTAEDAAAAMEFQLARYILPDSTR